MELRAALALVLGAGCAPAATEARPQPVSPPEPTSASVLYDRAREPVPDHKLLRHGSEIMVAVWATTPGGSDYPILTLYESGQVIYRRPNTDRLRLLEVTLPPSGARAFRERVDAAKLGEAPPYVECGGDTDDDYTLLVRDGDADAALWLVRQVFSLQGCAISDTRPPLADAVEFLVRWAHPDARYYEPEWLELSLMLTRFDETAGAQPWPIGLPHPEHVPIQQDEVDYVLDPQHFPTVVGMGAMAKTSGVFELDGRAWQVHGRWPGLPSGGLDAADKLARNVACLGRTRALVRCLLEVEDPAAGPRLGCAADLARAIENVPCSVPPADQRCVQAAPECQWP
ncbi:MAG: hypothetical protein AAF721_28030 [Myxococcota bacterium]